jgi:hypothetical protein
MLDLLIAILIALGCYVQPGETADEFKARNPEAYQKANYIMDSGSYRTDDGGGIIIVETGGD